MNLSAILNILLVLGGAVTVLAWCVMRCRRALHLLQLDSYSNTRLLKWLWAVPKTRLFEYRSFFLLAALIILAMGIRLRPFAYSEQIFLALWVLGGVALLTTTEIPEEKKPLVFTGRAKRIYGTALGVCGVALALPLGLGECSALVSLVIFLLVIQLAPFAVIAANLLLVPVQHSINRHFIRMARRKLEQFKPQIIAITGSYGKTSTKYFIERILSEKFEVLKTPQSYNTLLGICRVVNEQLQPQHQVFVVEIGAYQRGDVREKCDFVHPKIGVLTTIGPEHFERFKSMDNIIATNYELIEAIPADGTAIFNYDNEYTRALADKTTGKKVIRYGFDGSSTNLRLTAKDIQTGPDGLRFTIIEDSGRQVAARCRILGKHNVLNILGAACAAIETGMTIEEVARGIEKIEPAPHRLQIMPGSGGVTIIDDSYNSNPQGAAEALNTLSEFSAGKKVLVTPGMVELGVLEESANEEFGVQAAKVCDYVILVGRRLTVPIARGLKKSGFSPEKIRTVDNLGGATLELQKILASGDTVLFENDLPDLYGES